MLDLTVQPRFAHALTDLMQAYALAGPRFVRASAGGSVAMWARALRMTAPRPDERWLPLAPWGAWTLATCPRADDASPRDETGYASYRNASGHATAQVIVLEERRR